MKYIALMILILLIFMIEAALTLLTFTFYLIITDGDTITMKLVNKLVDSF